jgi:hypothetical protein
MTEEICKLSITEQAMRARTKIPDTREFVASPPVPAPDGYERQTPVQVIKIAHGYKARIVRRAVLAALAVLVAAVLAYLLPDLLA